MDFSQAPYSVFKDFFEFSFKFEEIFTIFDWLSAIIYSGESILPVTDSGERVCVDPREKGAILEVGGPSPPGGGKGWQMAPDSGGEGT